MFLEHDGLRRRFSPQILSPDFEQSLSEKTSTSLVLFPTFTRTSTRH
jgi:hypothetical protein